MEVAWLAFIWVISTRQLDYRAISTDPYPFPEPELGLVTKADEPA